MSRKPWSDAEVDAIRKSVATMNDAAIAKMLGWPAWRVLHVRKRYDIPAHHEEFWPKEALDLIHASYVVAGRPASQASAELKAALGLDIPEATIRRKALRMEWKRAPDAERRNSNLANARIGEAKRAKRKPKAAPAPAKARPLPGPLLSLHNAPKRWSAVEDHRPLDEKILSALKERPLSVMALASVIGAKEHAVDVQLAALAHAGGVEAGPAVECGRRNRLWRAAA